MQMCYSFMFDLERKTTKIQTFASSLSYFGIQIHLENDQIEERLKYMTLNSFLFQINPTKDL